MNEELYNFLLGKYFIFVNCQAIQNGESGHLNLTVR